jgi:hypothetical protein
VLYFKFVCIVILISMCCNFNYYASYFKLVCIVILIIMLFNLFFLKFIDCEMNSKMVKSEMREMTGRDKADVTDADVSVG